MTNINIDTNPVFKEKLLELGFVKKKGEFRREVGGVLQSLYFTYRNQGGSSTRYYTFNYGISFSARSDLQSDRIEYKHLQCDTK